MPEGHLAAVALGSNLPSVYGSSQDNLRIAVERVGKLGRVLKLSSFHVTEPVGYKAQPQFLNGALLLETALEPLELMRALLGIEVEIGRVREGVPAKGPRMIDLDLIFYDSLVLESPELILPHPAVAERAFVLEPLAEIARDWVHPMTGATVLEMLKSVPLPPGLSMQSPDR